MVMMDRVVATPKVGGTTDTKGFTMYDIMGAPTAKDFLESIARKSKASQRNYASGLLAFHKFLDGRYTLTTIVDSLKKNEVDVYVILNSFVAYLLLQAKHRMTGKKLGLKTIEGYMHGALFSMLL